ncbi:MAG: arylsulfatase [Tannerellaceae bacterium]|nr:arylsulfatase [Tannerellaceae bacterium]
MKTNKNTIPCILLGTSGILSLTACSKETNQLPNVIIILADDVGYGDLSCYGEPTIQTPNVDAVASNGLRFTDAHATSATSTPSRYGLLTGKYPWRVEGAGVAPGDAGMIIRPGTYTMASLFKEGGYTTGAVGKWHLGLGETSRQNWNGFITPGPLDIGFDYSFLMAATGDRVPCVYIENQYVHNYDEAAPIEVNYRENYPGEPTGRDNPELLKLHPSHGHDMSIVNGISRIGYMKGGGKALWQDETIADVITGKAVEFIKSSKEKPFFLYFGTNDIHVPRAPHQRFVGKSGMGARGDAILALDWTVGEIMKTLKETGIADNTLVIITSDNGPVVDDGYKDMAVELLGEHRPWGDFRGGKYSAYEAGTRVPFIVYWPKKIKQGISDALVTQLDLFASLASLLNISLPAGAAPDSEDYMETFLGKEQNGRSWVVEQNLFNTLSIVDEGWKYIEPSNAQVYGSHTNTEYGNDPRPQLYNLTNDKGEKLNVLEEYPDITIKLETMLTVIKAGKKP